jgi:hypothetical protein
MSSLLVNKLLYSPLNKKSIKHQLNIPIKISANTTRKKYHQWVGEITDFPEEIHRTCPIFKKYKYFKEINNDNGSYRETNRE